MKVFISWSGELSGQVAEIFGQWIECVLQGTETWISTEDIAKGSVSFTEISNQLSKSSFGILCLTPDNITAPWILFEAGALSKGLGTNRVCPLLINLTHKDISPPLSQFQASLIKKQDMHRLVRGINSENGEKRLAKEALDKAFDKWWEDFDEKILEVKNNYKPSSPVKPRTTDDIVTEILEIVRAIQNTSQQGINPYRQGINPQYRLHADWVNPPNIAPSSSAIGFASGMRFLSAAEVSEEADLRTKIMKEIAERSDGAIPITMLEGSTTEHLQRLLESLSNPPLMQKTGEKTMIRHKRIKKPQS
jgi:hypothetical protein